jgi:pimeloyl-ACP methyl ester carboxylesterase
MFRTILAALGLSLAFCSAALAQTATPAKTDYARSENWLCRPDKAADPCRDDAAVTVIAADGTRTSERFQPDPHAPVDCFYVYPTISRDPGILSDLIPGPEEAGVALVQAAPFATLCRVYAPIYRQATIASMRLITRPEDRPPESYEDVRAAWRAYLAQDNGGRGVILVGHSQGARHLVRLLKEEIDGKPAQDRLISALVIGSALPVESGRDFGALRHTPLCRAPGQTGCVITFATYQEKYPPSLDNRFGRTSEPGMVAACVNPAALSGGEGDLHPVLNNAGRFASPKADFPWTKTGPAPQTPFVAMPGWLAAQCRTVNGASILVVRLKSDPNDVRPGRIPGHLPLASGEPDPAWGLHMVDVSLTLGDLLDVTRRQSTAWIAAHPAP